VLISGSGRTLKNFIDLAARGELPIEIRLVVSSRPDAGGLAFARDAGVPTLVCRRDDYPPGRTGDEPYGAAIFAACRAAGVDFVAMAGFIKFAPVPADFDDRVVNIHPALIPAFSGHGFYGDRVHRAVIESRAKATGCTVHFVDNQYDHGPIILQRTVPVLADDTVHSLAERVFAAECQAYPEALRLLAAGRVQVIGGQVRILPTPEGQSSAIQPEDG
jgi:phosphoribosylglycinamide formyltransferase-1